MSTQIEALPTKAPGVELIPLKKLFRWDKNVRQTKLDEGVESLAESIAANGLLQPLTVKKAARGRYAVVIGGRRLRALGLLAESGRISTEQGITCVVREGDDAAMTEISLTENVHREPMHPADEFEAFKALIDQGQSAAEVAARFGVTEAVVRKRLTLARVSPWLLEQYRDGKMTLDILQAFSYTEDHEEQEQVWKNCPEYSRTVHYIKQRMAKESVSAERDRVVKFLGLEAYEEAGGEVRRSLFDEDVRVMDVALLETLAREHLEAIAEPLRKEGWKWVEVHPQPDHRLFSQFRQVPGTPIPLAEELRAEQSALEAERRQLEAERDTRLAWDDEEEIEEEETDDEEDEEEDEDQEEEVEEEEAEQYARYQARVLAVRQRLNEIAALQKYEYAEDQKAYSGVVVCVDHWGNLDIRHGLVRKGDGPKTLTQATPGSEIAEQDTPAEPGSGYSAVLLEALTEQKTAILQAELLSKPEIALPTVVHALLLSEFRLELGQASCAQIGATIPYLKEVEHSFAARTVRTRRAEILAKLPRKPEDLWKHCVELPQAELLDLLAVLTACTLDTVERRFDQNKERHTHAALLGDCMRVNPGGWYRPTAQDYFGRVSKAQIFADLTEVGKAPPDPGRFKKVGLAKYAEDAVKDLDWVPAPVRI